MKQELSPGPWIALIAVLVVAAAAYWWFVVRPGPTPPAAAEPTAAREEVVALPGSAEEPLVVAPETSTEDSETLADGEPAAEAAEERPEPAPAMTAPDDQVRLALSFTGDCWTEISDADGQSLFFEMGRAGRTVELAGTAPIAVLFGNVENVSLRVDGAAYPIVPTNPGSRTARLTIVQP
jgi:cytoskeleton protein RodZ